MAHFLVDQRAETEITVLASCDESGVGNRWLDGGSNLPIIIRSSALQPSTAGFWTGSSNMDSLQTSDGEGGRGDLGEKSARARDQMPQLSSPPTKKRLHDSETKANGFGPALIRT